MNGIYPQYKKVKIIVFTRNHEESERYQKLFAFMMKDKIEEMKNSPHHRVIITDEFEILFLLGNQSARGHRAHYVMNLTQGEEFDNCVAKPIEIISHFLKEDQKWKELI